MTVRRPSSFAGQSAPRCGCDVDWPARWCPCFGGTSGRFASRWNRCYSPMLVFCAVYSQDSMNLGSTKRTACFSRPRPCQFAAVSSPNNYCRCSRLRYTPKQFSLFVLSGPFTFELPVTFSNSERSYAPAQVWPVPGTCASLLAEFCWFPFVFVAKYCRNLFRWWCLNFASRARIWRG